MRAVVLSTSLMVANGGGLTAISVWTEWTGERPTPGDPRLRELVKVRVAIDDQQLGTFAFACDPGTYKDGDVIEVAWVDECRGNNGSVIPIPATT